MARAIAWRFCGARGESQVDWEGLLQNLHRRRLEGKELGLIVTDGCPSSGGNSDHLSPGAT